ncbi:uncharacterized protein TNCV_1949861 [Trichonephila clavipes]|nr:uncharacterized protein TNCV_1949861 [Trichonephila clavipes]
MSLHVIEWLTSLKISVAQQFEIDKKNVVARAWNAFQRTGTAIRKIGNDRPRKATTSDDCQLFCRRKETETRYQATLLGSCIWQWNDRYLANNERLIQMLADSYPMRKVARFAAGLIIRSKIYQERALENLKKVKDSSNIKVEDSDKFTQFMQDKVEKLKKILEEQKQQR